MKVLIAGGGTGGHLFPGIAVVEELRRRLALDVEFVGTARGIESRILRQRGEVLHLVTTKPLKGQGLSLFNNLAHLPRSGVEALALVKKINPDVVIGVGGYASGPILAAARVLGKKVAVMEQNAHVGLTNRLIAPWVGRAYLSFEHTRSKFGEAARVFGNPVRQEIVDAANRARLNPEGIEHRADTIFVLGGSQGSRALNLQVPAIVGPLAKKYGTKIVHQAGESMRESVEQAYAEFDVEVTVASFIDDMADVYRRAALVVARAGATTLAELCAIGRSAVYIPFPHAADDHQRHNAEALERDGAAICVPEDAIDAKLEIAIEGLLKDEDARLNMACAARNHGKPDAAIEIVDDLLVWLGHNSVTAEASPGSVRPANPKSDDGGRMQHSTMRRGYLKRGIGLAKCDPAKVRERKTLTFSGQPCWASA